MKLKICILFLFASITTLQAQNAKSILDNAAATYAKIGGISAKFTLNSKEIKTKSTFSSDGSIYMKGDKFQIDIPEATTWFDGKTQWAYNKGNEEVNISEPTGDELQGISPSSLFNVYKKGFNLAYKGEKNVAGKVVMEVELTPQGKTSNFNKIVVQIDKATNIFSQIVIYDKSGYENTLLIKKVDTGATLPDNTFVFDKAKYPEVEIVDLR